MERVRESLQASKATLIEELDIANEGRARFDMDLLDQTDYMAKIPADPAAKTRPRIATRADDRTEKEKRLERERQADDAKDAALARAELARLEARRSAKGGKDAPAYGTALLATWPLHRPGPLPSFAGGGGGGAGAVEPTAGMVFRQYAVLDSVQASKRHALAEKEALVRDMQKKLQSSAGSMNMTDMDVRSALESSRGVGQSAAARARVAALAAHGAARAAATTLGQLMFASGNVRRSAALGDEGMPILTAAAAESEDYLVRVQPTNRNVVAFKERVDSVVTRDRPLDVYVGVDDPFKAQKVKWAQPVDAFPV